jgi:hypothetical protein
MNSSSTTTLIITLYTISFSRRTNLIFSPLLYCNNIYKIYLDEIINYKFFITKVLKGNFQWDSYKTIIHTN